MFKYICLLFILFLCNVKSQTLNSDDKINLDTLLKKIQLSPPIDPTSYCGLHTQWSISCVNDGNISYVGELTLNATGSHSLTAKDINVFQNLTIATLVNFNFLPDFLKTQTLNSIFFYSPQSVANLFSSKISDSITSLSLFNVKSPITLSISLSNLKAIKSFAFKTDKRDVSNKFTLINDLPASTYIFTTLSITDLDDLPVMNNIKSNFLTINSYTEPVGGLNNLNTLSNISSIEISFVNSTTPTNFNQFSAISKINEITNIDFSGSLLKPTSKINLTDLNNLKKLSIKGITNSFNINGEVPLILPLNLTSLTIKNGEFNGEKAREFLFDNSGISSIVFSNNSINSSFTEWISDKKFSSLDLSSNNLYGNVNPSWCSSILVVSYNNLSGALPSCFTCHLQTSTYEKNFIGNSFTNIPPPICTTLIPNLRYDSSSKILTLYGQDLGFDPSQIKTTPQIKFDGNHILSELFTATYTDTLPEHIDITFLTAKQTYTVSTVQNPPLVSKITPSIPLNTLSFEGSFFNYNKSSFNINVGYNKCIITSATFQGVVCTLESPSSYDPNAIVSISIEVDDYSKINLTILTTKVYAFLNKTSSVTNCSIDCESEGKVCNTLNGICIKECPNHCSGPSYGTCNVDTGECSCTANYLGSDCLTPAVPCPNDCSNAGTCNKLNGTCTCIDYRFGLDCGSKNCTNTCEHSSTCDYKIGACKCVPNYQGSNCTIPSHYISSVVPCTINGGEVSIIGWFGDDQDYTHQLTSYNVKIGTLQCTVTYIDTTTIKCNLGAGTGTKNIVITNSLYPTVVFNGVGLFNYINPTKTCPNNCTSSTNGKCNTVTGDCICNADYTGFDCSSLKSGTTNPPTNSSVDTSSGNTTLSNQYTTYEISIIELNEISYDGSLVVSYPLYKNWTFMKNNTDLNTFKFIQTLNNTCTIAYIVEEIKSDQKSFTFGTTSFTLEKGAIKLSVLIKDYPYQSTLNTLQLVFYSTTGDDLITDCNEKESSTDTSNVDNQQLSSYIKITKNSKKLIGRFINQVIADSRSTFMSSTIIKNKNNDDSSITLGLNLPHCNECLIDPDFSVLVTDDFQNECGQSTRKKWVVPVAVVVPVVTIAAIVVVVSILYRKNRIGIKVFKTKLKSLR
ncbi:hypothetical protein ACTFIU_006228 [Dictyostelium citrinum]